jgi:hypothetical protein
MNNDMNTKDRKMTEERRLAIIERFDATYGSAFADYFSVVEKINVMTDGLDQTAFVVNRIKTNWGL